MQPLAFGTQDHRIAQRPRAFEAVDPRFQKRIFGIHIFIRRGILRRHRRVGRQRIGEHIETAARDDGRQQQQKDEYTPDDAFHNRHFFGYSIGLDNGKSPAPA